MSATRKTTASFTLFGRDHTDVPVLNPGDWFGRTWILELGGSYDSLYLAVEADSLSDAIDVLADDETFGHQIRIDLTGNDGDDWGMQLNPGDEWNGKEIDSVCWVTLTGKIVTDPEKGKYLNEPSYAGNEGIPVDTDHLMAYGDDRSGFAGVVYHIEGHDKPVNPADYSDTIEKLDSGYVWQDRKPDQLPREELIDIVNSIRDILFPPDNPERDWDIESIDSLREMLLAKGIGREQPETVLTDPTKTTQLTRPETD